MKNCSIKVDKCVDVTYNIGVRQLRMHNIIVSGNNKNGNINYIQL